MEHQIKEFTSPVLDKPLRRYKIVCPLHFFAFKGFFYDKDVETSKA